jgi:transcriptional regulator with XRE-family HTH domain
MHNDMKRVGRIIQAARISKGITQTVLADEIGISLRTVIAIENGQRNPTFETIASIIQVLNIPSDLIFRPGELTRTPEQEQFIQEYLNAGEDNQHLSMVVSRTIWREMQKEYPLKTK